MEVSRRELNKVKCRDRILKASRRLFSANGYDNTMIEEVAERAEISKATLYNYFPNKESLLIGIALEELEHLHRFVTCDLRELDSTLEKIYRLLEFFILDTIGYVGLSRKITYLNSCEESPLYSTRLELRKLFLGLAEEAQQKGEFRSDVDPAEIANLIKGVYLISQFEWPQIQTYTQEECSAKLRKTLNLILAGIIIPQEDPAP